MTVKETWFLILEEDGKIGIGECGILRTLSIDDRPDYEEKLQWVCQNIHLGKDKLWEELMEFPSIQFGVEMAFCRCNLKHLLIYFLRNLLQEKKEYVNQRFGLDGRGALHEKPKSKKISPRIFVYKTENWSD